MKKIAVLDNIIQEYAWGSLTAIPELTQSSPNPAKRPQAELWMGAHPKAPSTIIEGENRISLLDAIDKYPVEILGEQTAIKFNNRLPYLFKVLAAASPLSIQAHPNLEQAGKGYAKENQLKIPIDAKNRNYKDENHKPECICALTSFWALNGFRSVDETIEMLSRIPSDALQSAVTLLNEKSQPAESPHVRLRLFFEKLMTFEETVKTAISHSAACFAKPLAPNNPVFDWLHKLSEAYPGDIGVLSPIILNLVCLNPGEAMYLPAGQLHAYLDGVGIELMANSDNVLRGGLTPKHVDVPELLEVLRFEETAIERLTPVETNAFEGQYITPAEEFVLSTIKLKNGQQYQSHQTRSTEILLCTEGRFTFKAQKTPSTPIPVKKGVSVIVPASVPSYAIEGEGVLYKAGVPLA